MSLCLVCASREIPSNHVMCRGCYRDFEGIIREVQDQPYARDELRRKLWGQRFEKNRTPANRARIAYAAHVLASEGDDEALDEVRRAFETLAATEDVPPEEPKFEPATSQGRAVVELDKHLGHVARAADTPGSIRTKDGHFVRSKSERDIANFLFDRRIPYQYEKSLTIDGIEPRPDFYLPDVKGGLIIEHLGLLDDPSYRRYAEGKVGLYKQAGREFVVTDEKDALDMDAALLRKLGRYLPRLHDE